MSEEHEPSSDKDIDFDLNREAAILFTTGSSGSPKKVLHSGRAFFESARSTNIFYRFEPGDSWLVPLPMFHIGGLITPIRTLIGKGQTIFVPADSDISEEILSKKPDFVSLVPTQLYRLLKETEVVQQLQKCKAIVIGGAKASKPLLDGCREADLPLSLSYGSTESCAQMTATVPGEFKYQVVGQPLPGRDVKVGQQTVLFRGLGRFLGYVSGNRVEQPFDAKGWFKTNDRGWMVGSGLMISGRQDRTIVCGGECISLDGIEHEVGEIFTTGACRIIPIADEEYGEVPVIIFFSRDEPPVEEVMINLRKRLPGLAIPIKAYWSPGEPLFKPSESSALRVMASRSPVWQKKSNPAQF